MINKGDYNIKHKPYMFQNYFKGEILNYLSEKCSRTAINN